MGFFGSDSKTYSTTNLTQEDKSVQAAGDAGNIVGSEGVLASPASVVVSGAPNTTLGDIIFNQFPEQVAETVGALVQSVDRAVSVTSASQLASTQALGQKLSDLQVGEAAILPKIILYVVLGGGAIFLGSRLMKR